MCLIFQMASCKTSTFLLPLLPIPEQKQNRCKPVTMKASLKANPRVQRPNFSPGIRLTKHQIPTIDCWRYKNEPISRLVKSIEWLFFFSLKLTCTCRCVNPISGPKVDYVKCKICCMNIMHQNIVVKH